MTTEVAEFATRLLKAYPAIATHLVDLKAAINAYPTAQSTAPRSMTSDRRHRRTVRRKRGGGDWPGVTRQHDLLRGQECRRRVAARSTNTSPRSGDPAFPGGGVLVLEYQHDEANAQNYHDHAGQNGQGPPSW